MGTSTRITPASVLIASSADFHHWTAPEPLIGPLQGQHSELVLTAAGFHQHDGTLIAYFGQYEYDADAIRSGIKRAEITGIRGCGP